MTSCSPLLFLAISIRADHTLLSFPIALFQGMLSTQSHFSLSQHLKERLSVASQPAVGHLRERVKRNTRTKQGHRGMDTHSIQHSKQTQGMDCTTLLKGGWRREDGGLLGRSNATLSILGDESNSALLHVAARDEFQLS